MSPVVVTGTGLLTAAGLGSERLARALQDGQSLVQTRPDGLSCSDVALELVTWPDHPQWQASREFAGRAALLAVTACQQALASALGGAAPLDPERSATVTVGRDDWTEQSTFDAAVARAGAASDEARVLFAALDDHFLLRTFRWGISYAVGAITQAQGPSVSMDPPAFGGLSGLRHALDLLDSGEADAVMLLGVDTLPRLDLAATMERLQPEAGAIRGFGQAAAAVLLERPAAARARGARALSRVLDCELWLSRDSASRDAEPARAPAVRTPAAPSPFSSQPILGLLPSSGALVDLCLTSDWLAHREPAAPNQPASVQALEAFWARGGGRATLGSVAGDES